MRAVFRTHRVGLYLYVFGSVAALALGPFQLSSRLRARCPGAHRWMGRLYLGVGVLVGGLAGLFLALHAFGGAVARLGFASLAVCWVSSGFLALRAIRRGDVPSHRRWMVRNFALTFAAVMLRLYVPLSAVLGIPLESAYPAIAWLCWVPNLAVAKRFFNRATRGVAS
jgi:uncharacterized membrane protein